MMTGKGPIGGTFEKINQASGGVAAAVAGGLKDAAEAATIDVARSPLEQLKSLLTGGSGDKAQETTTSASGDTGIEDVAATVGGGGQVQPQSDLMAKMEQARQERENKLRQARMMLEAYQQQNEVTKQEEEQRRQGEERKEEQKKTQIRQLEQQKKQEAMAVTVMKRDLGGAHEGAKKKF